MGTVIQTFGEKIIFNTKNELQYENIALSHTKGFNK